MAPFLRMKESHLLRRICGLRCVAKISSRLACLNAFGIGSVGPMAGTSMAGQAQYFRKDPAHTLAAEIELSSAPLPEDRRGGSISCVVLDCRV
jgi:hypothetical protein